MHRAWPRKTASITPVNISVTANIVWVGHGANDHTLIGVLMGVLVAALHAIVGEGSAINYAL